MVESNRKLPWTGHNPVLRISWYLPLFSALAVPSFYIGFCMQKSSDCMSSSSLSTLPLCSRSSSFCSLWLTIKLCERRQESIVHWWLERLPSKGFHKIPHLRLISLKAHSTQILLLERKKLKLSSSLRGLALSHGVIKCDRRAQAESPTMQNPSFLRCSAHSLGFFPSWQLWKQGESCVEPFSPMCLHDTLLSLSTMTWTFRAWNPFLLWCSPGFLTFHHFGHLIFTSQPSKDPMTPEIIPFDFCPNLAAISNELDTLFRTLSWKFICRTSQWHNHSLTTHPDIVRMWSGQMSSHKHRSRWEAPARIRRVIASSISPETQSPPQTRWVWFSGLVAKWLETIDAFFTFECFLTHCFFCLFAQVNKTGSFHAKEMEKHAVAEPAIFFGPSATVLSSVLLHWKGNWTHQFPVSRRMRAVCSTVALNSCVVALVFTNGFLCSYTNARRAEFEAILVSGLCQMQGNDHFTLIHKIDWAMLWLRSLFLLHPSVAGHRAIPVFYQVITKIGQFEHKCSLPWLNALKLPWITGYRWLPQPTLRH